MAKISARQTLAYRMELTAWFGLAIFIVGLIAQIVSTAVSYVFFTDWSNSLESPLHDESASVLAWVLPVLAGLVAPIVAFMVGERNAKLVSSIIPNEITANAVAAYLMPITVNSGLHQYWLTIAKK